LSDTANASAKAVTNGNANHSQYLNQFITVQGEGQMVDARKALLEQGLTESFKACFRTSAPLFSGE
jgi:hypothetical protein